MSQEPPSTPLVLSAPARPPVKLWTSRAVAYTTFFLGFPGGFALAALNWMRMGLTKKAISHTVGAAVVSMVFAVLVLFLPGAVGTWSSFLVSIGVMFYLQDHMRKDIQAFKASNREVRNAHWFGGVLIALAMLGLLLALVFVVALVLSLVGVPMPE